MRSRKIFISAYACEPGLGSEIGVGWHWVLELSKYYDLWVLTRKSNQHTIEPWIAEHPEYSKIHWLYYDLPKWARFWKKGLRGVRTYYLIWQTLSDSIVKRTMQKENIKVFFHVTYGNALNKVSSYGQRQFFVWGPIGGLETINKEYSSYYHVKWRVIEFVRRIIVRTLSLNCGFRNRCKNANLILCKTDITRQLIPDKYRCKAVLQTDVATEKYSSFYSLDKSTNNRLEIITVGRLDAWRGFDLCIEAVKIAKDKGVNLHLSILGKGSDKNRLISLVHDYKLEDIVSFVGQVPVDEYKSMLANADVVLNASLKEGAVTVSFDAMAMGKPMICLDTTGYTRYFNSEYAAIVPITARHEVINNLANAIVKLSDSSLRMEMGKNAVKAAHKFSWETRGKEVYELLESKLHDVL